MNLYAVCPDLPTSDFSNILPSLERNHISVSDLLSLEAQDVAKRAQIPVREVTRLVKAVLTALHGQYGFGEDSVEGEDEGSEENARAIRRPALALTSNELLSQWRAISTLDESLDTALDGGIPLGYLTEITGESGAGKTQLLMTLCLSIQLAPTNRNALYISTEAPLQTPRLAQMLKTHPSLCNLPDAEKPNLSRILSISTPDLESQDHILRYQVPVAIKRHDIGLLVIDSVTANYRAELSREDASQTQAKAKNNPGASMARRTAQLMALGSLLRDLARTHDIAIVVANQVADRFRPDERFPTSASSSHPHPHPHTSASARILSPTGTPTAYSQPPGLSRSQPQSHPQAKEHNPLTLPHQQNFFTGWGDDPTHQHNMKTPSLGLVWSNEIAARIALVVEAARGAKGGRRRFFKVVFAPWAMPTEGRGVEFEILGEGVRGVVKEGDRVREGAQDAGVG